MPPAEERGPSGVSAGAPVAVVRRFLDEVVNGGNLEAIEQLWAEDLAWHGGSLGDVHGRAALKAHMADSASGAFTGMHLTVTDIVAAGNKVAVRFTNSGTQTGPFLGAPPTGKHASGWAVYNSEGRRPLVNATEVAPMSACRTNLLVSARTPRFPGRTYIARNCTVPVASKRPPSRVSRTTRRVHRSTGSRLRVRGRPERLLLQG